MVGLPDRAAVEQGLREGKAVRGREVGKRYIVSVMADNSQALARRSESESRGTATGTSTHPREQRHVTLVGHRRVDRPMMTQLQDVSVTAADGAKPDTGKRTLGCWTEAS